MTQRTSYSGKCFCGAVGFTLDGEPKAMGYCHCTSCRHWSAGPVNAFTLWEPRALKITHGAGELGAYRKTENSIRHWCTRCGGHLFTEHPGLGLTDVYAALLPSMPFQPEVHVNYAEAVLHIHDGLLKLRDFPAEFGGSGATLPE